MGQKTRPDSFRLGITRLWNARWFPKKNFRAALEEDWVIRKAVTEKVASAGIVEISIERGTSGLFKLFIKVARPGFVIGRGGKGIEDLNRLIEERLRALFRRRGEINRTCSLSVTIEELRRSEISAAYLAQSIAWDLEKRLPARRTLKRYVELALQQKDVQGVKIRLAGRIDGAEIARREWLAKGRLPLQTLRADIDYGEATTFSSYGTVGVKTWIYRGEVFRTAGGRDPESRRTKEK